MLLENVVCLIGECLVKGLRVFYVFECRLQLFVVGRTHDNGGHLTPAFNEDGFRGRRADNLGKHFSCA